MARRRTQAVACDAPDGPVAGQPHPMPDRCRYGRVIVWDPEATRTMADVIDIVLHRPQIPPNTGNVMRLCANTGVRLHLIRPLGFDLADAQLRRAGLDYRDVADVVVHDDWSAAQEHFPDRIVYMLTGRGQHSLFDADLRVDPVLVLGTERSGLPDGLVASVPERQRLRLPMAPDSRSLNLSNAAAVALYEAWRQQGFPGAVDAAAPDPA